MNIQHASNVGDHVTRALSLCRKLQGISADSFTDKAEIYQLATDAMLELEQIRRLTDDRASKVFDPNDLVHRIFGISPSEKGV